MLEHIRKSHNWLLSEEVPVDRRCTAGATYSAGSTGACPFKNDVRRTLGLD